MAIEKIDTVPENHIIADRRHRKIDRRMVDERRDAIRWEPEKHNRRNKRKDRRKSMRTPWDSYSKPV